MFWYRCLIAENTPPRFPPTDSWALTEAVLHGLMGMRERAEYSYEENAMSPDSHRSALQEKHQELEAQIDSESSRPAPDQARLTSLKREKLKIRDEIDRVDP